MYPSVAKLWPVHVFIELYTSILEFKDNGFMLNFLPVMGCLKMKWGMHD